MSLSPREILFSFLSALLLVAVIFHPITFGGKTLSNAPLLPTVFSNGVWHEGASFGELNNVHFEVPQTVVDSLGATITDEVSPYLAHQMYFSGHIPWLNPYQGLGHPWAADLMSAVFFPLQFLVIAWPSVYTWDAYLLLRLLVFGWFAYLYLRRIGLGRVGAGAGGAFCACGGYAVGWVNLFHVNVDLMAPLLLYFVESAIQSRQRKWLLAMAASVGVAFLGGNPQPLLLIFVMLFVYAAIRILIPWGENPSGEENRFVKLLRTHLWLGVCILAGIALAAFLVFPFLELYRDSYNTHPKGVSATPVSAGNRLFFLFPALYSNELAGNVLKVDKAGSHNPLCGPGLALVPFVLMAWFHWRRFFSHLLAFTLLGGLFTAKICGISYWGVVEKLPILSGLLFAKYQIITIVSVSVLVAIGVDYAWLTARRDKAWVTRIALLVVAGAALWLPFVWLHGWLKSYAGQLNGSGCAVRTSQMLLYYGWLAPAAFACFAAFVLVRKIPPSGRLILLFAPFFFESLMNTDRPYAQRSEVYAQPPFVKFLKERQKSEPEWRMYGVGEVLYPNTACVYGIEDFRHFDALVWEPFHKFVQMLVTGRETGFYEHFSGSRYPQVLDNPIWDLLNVRYIVSDVSPMTTLVTSKLASQGSMSKHPGAHPGVNAANINGRKRQFLYFGAPESWSWKTQISDPEERLRFFVTPDRCYPSGQFGDGMGFRVWGEAGGKRSLLFSRYIDPRRLENQHWFDVDVALGQYCGQNVQLTFEATPGARGDARCDMSLWGDFSVRSLDRQAERYRLVYDKEIYVYENRHALGREFLAPSLRTVKSWEQMQQFAQADPANLALRPLFFSSAETESAKKRLDAAEPTTNSAALGKVELLQRGPEMRRYRVQAARPVLLFVSNLAYPGWGVSIDHARGTLLRAFGCMQAVVVEPGTHEVEFRYAARSVCLGWIVSAATLLALLGFGFWKRRPRQQDEAAA